jgi:hypothetical protein
VLDTQICTEPVELVRARRGTLAQAEQAIRELLAVITQNGADADRTNTLKVLHKPAGIGRGLCFEDADEDPASRTVNRHEQITTRSFVSNLSQLQAFISL